MDQATPAIPLPDVVSGHAGRRFLRGMRLVVRGAGLLARRPSWWPLVVFPVLLSAAMCVAAGAFAWAVTFPLLDWLFDPTTPLGLAAWLVGSVAVGGLVFLTAAVVLYFGVGVLASPFNDRLSELVEDELIGPRDEPWTWRLFLGDAAQSIAHTLLGLLLWAAVMIVVAAMNLVPGVGSVIGFACGTAATAFFLAREVMDGSMSRRRLGFAHKLRVVWANLALLEGFGVAMALLLWIPLMNFLVLPIGVVGGTMIFCALERQGRLPPA